jgi:methylthioribulose-1-phosphate dehydratase
VRPEDVTGGRAEELIAAGRFFFERGWVPATAGNLSARLEGGQVLVTVSGRHKGALGPEDFLVVDVDGRVLSEGKRPSAELPLHLQLYRRNEQVGAVLHTHSLSATVLSRLQRDELVLEDYEVLKALPGISTHQTRVVVPVFPNDQDVGRLAARVEEHMEKRGSLYGYLIAGHGFYTWGRSVAEACRHIEAFEFLFDCELELRRLGR